MRFFRITGDFDPSVDLSVPDPANVPVLGLGGGYAQSGGKTNQYNIL